MKTLLVLALVVIGLLAFRVHLRHRKAIAEASGPPVHVEAATLWTAYHSDKAAAERAYLDHPLVVDGVVESVDKNSLAPAVILLRGPMPADYTMAHVVHALDARATTLHAGEHVTLACIGAGTMIGHPTLQSCTFE